MGIQPGWEEAGRGAGPRAGCHVAAWWVQTVSRRLGPAQREAAGRRCGAQPEDVQARAGQGGDTVRRGTQG